MPKIFRSIIVSLAAIVGLLFLLKIFLSPPKASINSAPLDSQGEVIPEKQSEEIDSDSPIALNQPEEMVLETPKNLERGAELKIYPKTNIDKRINIASYSPTRLTKTNNIALQPGVSHQFQVSSGYFEVKERGQYNFLIDINTLDQQRLTTDNLQIIIDNEPLKRVLGGQVALDPGWHKIELYYNPAFFAGMINVSQINLKWAKPGKVAQTIEVWREAEEREAKLKNQEVAN